MPKEILEQHGAPFYMPRILFVIDEFQQLFSIDRLVESVKKYIQALAKLGRALGVHLFFTSQDMKGTIGDVLDQFKLRICLPATKEVSKEIIGTEEGARIIKGYAVVSTNKDLGEEATKLVRVPYIPNDALMDTLIRCCEITESQKSEYTPHELVLYDEAEVKSMDTLTDELSSIREMDTNSVILLGDKAVYTTQDVPAFFKLENTEKDNILILAKSPNTVDRLRLTLLNNLVHKQNSQFYFVNGSRQFTGKVDIHAILGDKLLKFDDKNDMGQAVGYMQAAYEKRKDKEYKDYKPTYLILHNGDRLSGVGSCQSSMEDKIRSALQSLMKDYPMSNIRVIITSTTYKGTGGLANLCTHRLVGRTDEDDAYSIGLNKVANTLDDNIGIYNNPINDNYTKFKIYDCKFNNVEDDEIVLVRG